MCHPMTSEPLISAPFSSRSASLAKRPQPRGPDNHFIRSTKAIMSLSTTNMESMNNQGVASLNLSDFGGDSMFWSSSQMTLTAPQEPDAHMITLIWAVNDMPFLVELCGREFKGKVPPDDFLKKFHLFTMSKTMVEEEKMTAFRDQLVSRSLAEKWFRESTMPKNR